MTVSKYTYNDGSVVVFLIKEHTGIAKCFIKATPINEFELFTGNGINVQGAVQTIWNS